MITDGARKVFIDTFTAGVAELGSDRASFRTAGRRSKAMPNGEDFDWWVEAGSDMVTAYYNWRRKNKDIVLWETPTGQPAIELSVNVTLEDGTVVKAFIDRVFQDFSTGELLIVDLKSGKNTPTPIQLAVYRMMIDETFGFAPKYGSYWMAREGTLAELIDLDAYPTSMVKRWMRDTRKAIDLGITIPHVSRDCGYCAVKQHCYAWGSDFYTPDFNSDIHMTPEGSNNE